MLNERISLLWVIIIDCCWIFVFAEIGLPMIQISHDEIDNDYPELQEKVRLEDFFWTGSGDGPPEFVKNVHTGISRGKEVIVKTETVVATVYVDGKNEVDIPICLDCFPDDGGGGGIGRAGIIPFNFSSIDRRYWLLTVMSGFHAPKDNPLLEEKLARLYRIAFRRQLSKHLGIGNGVVQISENMVHSLQETTTEEGTLSEEDEDEKIMRRKRISSEEFLTNTNEDNGVKSMVLGNTDLPFESIEEITSTSETTTASLSSKNMNFTNGVLQLKYSPAVGVVQPHHGSSPAAAILNGRAAFNFTHERIRVVIHNVTQFTEDEIQSGTFTTSSQEEDINSIRLSPIANQTEIIYSVFVNGRPVLATAAANDMKLVSESEVVNELGKEIFMKAEPYLREPLATPLAPATQNGNIGFFTSIHENPFLYIVTSVAVLLLLILLITLLLMGLSHRDHSSDVKRTSSRNVLLGDSISSPNRTVETVATGRTTIASRDVGVQNFSFESENERIRSPRVNFAARVASSVTRSSSFTSSENTSDSSVYCPIDAAATTTNVQRMLDDKAASLFDKRRHSKHYYDRAEGHEAVYTSVMTDKKQSSKSHKSKRRYISENRVGSIDDEPSVHRRTQQNSSTEEVTDSNESLVEALHPNYENFERVEAYNSQNNYHRNKLLQNRVFTDGNDVGNHSAESINQKIIQALQPSEKSSETGSIGSFLSIASLKSFPKSSHPEPLNRVLDPVFVTYYNNLDESAIATQQQQSNIKVARKSSSRHANTGIDAFAKLPAPKAPLKSVRIAPQSDHQDPGVIGPIVWEIHKKQMITIDNADNLNISPVRDPVIARNHYEGLLEGAIQMYSSQDDLPTPLPTKNFTNNRRPTKRENRGKSAEISSSNDVKKMNYSYLQELRPATAQPEKLINSNTSTQPPSPSSGAWGGSYSPKYRPVSAGPRFKQSKTKNFNATSAAPLIEAIQNELQNFKQQSYTTKRSE